MQGSFFAAAPGVAGLRAKEPPRKFLFLFRQSSSIVSKTLLHSGPGSFDNQVSQDL
jgi:hypothetical protein